MKIKYVETLLIGVLSILSVSAWGASPLNLTSDIDWVDSGGSGNDAAYASIADIELSYNRARRQEEIQLNLPPHSLGDLILPPEPIWASMDDDSRALYILNSERTSRQNAGPGVIGLPFSGVERSIEKVAEDYASLLVQTNKTGHFQPSGNQAIDNPDRRIDSSIDIGSSLDCHEELARSEALAYFQMQFPGNVAKTIPMLIERAIFSWIYSDSASNWHNRETVLLQDKLTGATATGLTEGYKNNYSSNRDEGFIGVHVAGSEAYTPLAASTASSNLGVVVVLNTFDPVADSDATVRGCKYNVVTSREDLPKPANRAPLAVDDQVSTPFNTPSAAINVLGNDSDPDGDSLHITKHTLPKNGSLNRQGNSFLYTPKYGFSGKDSFTYTITDGGYEQTTATAIATAIAIYSPDVSAANTDSFTFTFSSGDNGVATADASGVADVTYTPSGSPNTSQTITFSIVNSEDKKLVATATASASASNRDATATANAKAVAIYSPDTIISDTKSHTFTISQGSGEATADAQAIANVLYTPGGGANGQGEFTYTIINGNGEEIKATTIAMAMATATATVSALTAETATVHIKVAENQPPSFVLSQKEYTVDSDSGRVDVPKWVKVVDDGEGGKQLPFGGNSRDEIRFFITSNSNPGIFAKQPWVSFPSHGLHFTPKEYTGGTAEVCMKAVDLKGKGLSSKIQCFKIHVKEIPNNPPSLTLKSPASYEVYNDAGKVTVPGWVVEADDGEGGKQLPFGGNSKDVIYFFITSNSNPGIFEEKPWVSYPSQSLHFIPKKGAEGTAKVCVKGIDLRGSGLSSEPKCFSIVVKSLPNNPPVLVLKQSSPYSVFNDAGSVTVPGWVAEARDGEGGTQLPFGGDSKDKIVFATISNSNPGLFKEQPWVSHPSQALHFEPNPGASGSADICIAGIDKDGKGIQSEPVCFTINVMPRAVTVSTPSSGDSAEKLTASADLQSLSDVQSDSATRAQGVENAAVSLQTGGGVFGGQVFLTILAGIGWRLRTKKAKRVHLGG